MKSQYFNGLDQITFEGFDYKRVCVDVTLCFEFNIKYKQQYTHVLCIYVRYCIQINNIILYILYVSTQCIDTWMLADSNESSDVKSGHVDYISTIFKYFDKNQLFIKNIINYKQDILLCLVKICFTCDKTNVIPLIESYFNVCNKCQYCFNEKIFDESIQFCKENKMFNQTYNLIPIITQNFNKLKAFLPNKMTM